MRVDGGPVGESEGRWGPQVQEAGRARERAGEYPEGPEGNPEKADGKSGRHRSNPRKEPVQNRERGGTRGISDTGANRGQTGDKPSNNLFFLTIPNKSSPEGSDGGRALPFFCVPRPPMPRLHVFAPHARPCRISAFLRPPFHFHAFLPSILSAPASLPVFAPAILPFRIHPPRFACAVAPPFTFTLFHAPSPPLSTLHLRRRHFPFWRICNPETPFSA